MRWVKYSKSIFDINETDDWKCGNQMQVKMNRLQPLLSAAKRKCLMDLSSLIGSAWKLTKVAKSKHILQQLMHLLVCPPTMLHQAEPQYEECLVDDWLLSLFPAKTYLRVRIFLSCQEDVFECQ